MLIDPLQKLNLKKDSTLMLAMTLKEQGFKTAFFFEKDFSFINKKPVLKVYSFKGKFLDNYSCENLTLNNDSEEWQINSNVVLHMRLDPPFDYRYLRCLWLLKLFEEQGATVINSPLGVASYNEKVFAYAQKNSHLSWIGSDLISLYQFCQKLKEKRQDFVVLKPLDLYQGMGVEKVSLNDYKLKEILQKNILQKTILVAQPYIKQVEKGEIRSLYYAGKEIGSILKIPPEGQFLANIAQGASYRPIKLPKLVGNDCARIAKDLLKKGVPWIAFDILGKKISEVNITCPGLLVEVSKAHQKNLALTILKSF